MCLRWGFQGERGIGARDKGPKDRPILWTPKLADPRTPIRANSPSSYSLRYNLHPANEHCDDRLGSPPPPLSLSLSIHLSIYLSIYRIADCSSESISNETIKDTAWIRNLSRQEAERDRQSRDESYKRRARVYPRKSRVERETRIVKRDDGGAAGDESNGGSLRIEACRAGCHRALVETAHGGRDLIRHRDSA